MKNLLIILFLGLTWSCSNDNFSESLSPTDTPVIQMGTVSISVELPASEEAGKIDVPPCSELIPNTLSLTILNADTNVSNTHIVDFQTSQIQIELEVGNYTATEAYLLSDNTIVYTATEEDEDFWVPTYLPTAFTVVSNSSNELAFNMICFTAVSTPSSEEFESTDISIATQAYESLVLQWDTREEKPNYPRYVKIYGRNGELLGMMEPDEDGPKVFAVPYYEGLVIRTLVDDDWPGVLFSKSVMTFHENTIEVSYHGYNGSPGENFDGRDNLIIPYTTEPFTIGDDGTDERGYDILPLTIVDPRYLEDQNLKIFVYGDDPNAARFEVLSGSEIVFANEAAANLLMAIDVPYYKYSKVVTYDDADNVIATVTIRWDENIGHEIRFNIDSHPELSGYNPFSLTQEGHIDLNGDGVSNFEDKFRIY